MKNNKELLTKEQEFQLFIKYRETKSPLIRNKILEHNLGLVYKQVYQNKYIQFGLDNNDLVQNGIKGLMKAIEKFDPLLGNKFSSCAIPWINKYIKEEINELTHNIKIPNGVMRKYFYIKKMERELSADDHYDKDYLLKKVKERYKRITLSEINEIISKVEKSTIRYKEEENGDYE